MRKKSVSEKGLSGRNLLVYVEDPGAANLVLGLTEKLTSIDCRVFIVASKSAQTLLSHHNEEFISFNSDLSADHLLREYQPSLVACGTSEDPETIGLSLISAARRSGILTVGLVDAAMNERFRFRGKSEDPLFHRPEKILVTSRKSIERFVEIGVNRSDIFLFQNPAFLLARQKRRVFDLRSRAQERGRIFGTGLAARKIICFLSERSDGLNSKDLKRSVEYTIRGRGQTRDRTKIVLEELIECCKELSKEIRIVVCLHPQEQPGDYLQYKKEVLILGGGVPSLEASFFSDLVVGLTTTLLEEVRVLGAPVLSIIPRELERNWVPFPITETSRIACSREEIKVQVSRVLGDANERRRDQALAMDQVPELVELLILLMK